MEILQFVWDPTSEGITIFGEIYNLLLQSNVDVSFHFRLLYNANYLQERRVINGKA